MTYPTAASTSALARLWIDVDDELEKIDPSITVRKAARIRALAGTYRLHAAPVQSARMDAEIAMLAYQGAHDDGDLIAAARHLRHSRELAAAAFQLVAEQEAAAQRKSAGTVQA